MAAALTIGLGSRPVAAGQGAPNLVPDNPQQLDSMNLDASEELLSDGDLEMNENSKDEVEEIFGMSKEAETTDRRNRTVDFQFGMGATNTKEAVRAQNKKNAGNSNKNNNGALVTVGPLFHPGSTSNGQIPHDKEHRSKLRKLSRGQEAIEGSAETEVVSNTSSGSVMVCATAQAGQQGGAVKGTGKRSISPTSQIEITMSGGVKEKPPDKEIHCNRDQMDMHVEVGTLVAVEEQLKEGQLIVDFSGISNS